MKNALIILDRDGVLNKLLIRPDGSTDSPMSIEEIEVFPWVAEQLKILNIDMGYGLVIATNQPAAAKGKVSFKNLLDIHEEIKKRIQINNGLILDSFICLHRSEDNCECRKPKIGLLSRAFEKFSNFQKNNSWMVGDRATDIIAGHSFGIKTALLGPSVIEDLKVLNSMNISPNYYGKDLRDFTQMIMNNGA